MIAVSSGVKNQMQERVMYLIAFGMVVMNIFVYYLISDIMEHEAKLHEKEILEMQEKNQVELYHSMLEHYEQQKRRSHEFKNHILCMETLAREKQYDELVKYLNQISEQIVDGDRQIDTNHIIVNAILNKKKFRKDEWTEYDCLTRQILGVSQEELLSMSLDEMIDCYEGDPNRMGKIELAAVTLLKVSDEAESDILQKSKLRQDGLSLLKYVQKESSTFSIQRTNLIRMIEINESLKM